MRTIILDAGHGIDTPGKRSPVWSDGKQFFEWEFARDVVSRIAKGLTQAGIPHKILVPGDKDVSLSERSSMANKLSAAVNGNAVLISVHANAAAKPNTASGWEAHTYTGKSKSDTFADLLWEEAKKLLGGQFPMRGDFTDGDKDWDSNFAILRSTTCPAVLTENLFMDNEKDCRFLMSSEGRDVIAKIHIEAIKKIALM